MKKKCQWSKVTGGLGVLLLGSKMIVYQHDSAPHEENVEIQNFFLDIFLFTLAVEDSMQILVISRMRIARSIIRSNSSPPSPILGLKQPLWFHEKLLFQNICSIIFVFFVQSSNQSKHWIGG